MPDITDLLDRAAPDAGGPAPFDSIVRRGRRRQLATRAVAVAAPVAVAAVVAGVILTGGTPTGIEVVDPPMAETPDPTPPPEPSPSEPAEPAPDGNGDPSDAAADGWLEPTDLQADVLVVEADGGVPQVVRMGADGSLQDLAIEAGVPNAAGLVPDATGGFTWQPDWRSAGPAPVLHMDADGTVRTLVEGGEGSTTLVGRDLGLDRALVTRGSGNTIEDTTADLLAVPVDGGEVEVVRAEVGAWESGIAHAAMLETALYNRYVEALQQVVLDPPDAEPQVVYEAGEATGEYLGGVAILRDEHLGVALVGRMSGLGDEPEARLLLVDLATGAVREELAVPMDHGFEGGEAWPGTEARDVSVADGQVLVNRRFEGEWVAPLVYDTGSETWSELEHRDAGPVIGRATLTPPVAGDAGAAPAACATEDDHLRNAAPGDDGPFVYLPCRDSDAITDVYRLLAGIGSTGDTGNDLDAVLGVLLGEPVPEGQQARGYRAPVDAGDVLVNALGVDGGEVVVDLRFPNGTPNNLSTSALGGIWQRSLLGTVFQFEDVETVEFRLDGSCEDYAAVFEGDGCRVFPRADAPWGANRS